MDTPERLRDLAVSETGFVFDPYTGATYSVNGTGMAILAGLRRGLEREAIVRQVQSQFEAEDADVSRDVDEFVHVLRENGLVPTDFVLE